MIDAKWDELMAAGWGKWPSVRFIEWFMRLPRTKPRHEIKCLELGCGAGAQMRFLAEEGFDVQGIDGSRKALDAAADLLGKRTFGKQYWNTRLYQHDLERPDQWDHGQFDGQFDVIYDVCSLQHLDVERAQDLLASARAFLKPGGYLFSMWASPGTDVRRGTPVPNLLKPDEVPILFKGFALQIGAEAVHTFDGQVISHLLIEARKRDGQ